MGVKVRQVEDVRKEKRITKERGVGEGKKQRSGSCVISKRSSIKRENSSNNIKDSFVKEQIFCNTVGQLGRNAA